MSPMERRNLHGRVTDESYDAWREIAALYGVSVSSLMEALGERFADILAGGPITVPGREVVERAREIAQAHRSRRDKS